MVFLKSDKGEVQKLLIPSILYVGRGNSSDIRPDSKSVSKRHGQLTVLFNAKTGKAEAWIEDFNSTFGTFVGETPENLEKITQKTRLFFGFYIRFGHAPYCYQYLELDPDDNETSVAKAADLVQREQISSSNEKVDGQLSADEEFAMLLQEQLNESETSPKPRIKTFVDQFETSAQSSPECRSMKSSKTNLQELAVVRDIVSKFEATSSRTPSPQSSAKFEGNKKKQLAKLNTESFSDSAWAESQSLPPTPTICSPPSKKDEFKFQPGKDLEEKASFGDNFAPGGLSVCEFDATMPSGKQYQTVITPGSKSQPSPSGGVTSAQSSSRLSSPRGSPALTQSSDRPMSSKLPQPPYQLLEKASSKSVEQRPLSAIEQSTANAVHKNNLQDLSVVRARQIFRQNKRSGLLSVEHKYSTYGAVAKQWRKAVAEVDTIAGGFCISLVLPYLEKVKIKPVGRKLNKIRIDARRWITPGDDFSSDADSEYVGEFKLQGLRSQVSFEDLTHDYCEDTGLLCVYVNRFRLKDPRVFVAQHNFPSYLSSKTYVPVNSAEDRAMRGTKKQDGWFSHPLVSWLGRSRRKEERTLEKDAEVYRRSLNANPRTSSKKKKMKMNETSEVDPSAPEEPPLYVEKPSSRPGTPVSGRELNSQKSMESLKEFMDMGIVDTNVEFI